MPSGRGAAIIATSPHRSGATPITASAVNGQTPASSEDTASRTVARPFVKWAGGKTQIVDELLALAPARIDTYYEPFVGGGALFFRLAADPKLRPQRAVLNDLNSELMATFRAVRDDVDTLIARLQDLQSVYRELDFGGRDDRFYEVREEYRELVTGGNAQDIELAARLLFLNKTCFNGLYRVNRSGQFNVPHGRYANPRILDESGLRAASEALATAELTSVDFEEACAGAGPNDFVYFDPPFYPVSSTSSFTAYTGSDFNHRDQLRLKLLADGVRAHGAEVLLSNSDREWVIGAYEASDYHIEYIEARRMINADGDGRGPIRELAIMSYELPTTASSEK